MDYEQHMYGRSSYDPSRARGTMHRESGISGILILVGAIISVLALVVWMADGQSGKGLVSSDPVANVTAAIQVTE